MAVYSHRMLGLLTESLNKLSFLMFSKSPLILSGDEFLEAFVDPNHISMLRQVQEICKPGVPAWANTVLHTEDGETINMQIQFAGNAPVILPKYVQHGLQPSCPQAIKDKINTWMGERINFGRAFGDVRDGIDYLNEHCGDVEAMTLLMPCMPTIMSGISTDGENKAVKRAQKLASINRFGKLPRLPRQVTQRLSEASALVNATTLMQDAPDPSPNRYDAMFTIQMLTGSTRTNIFYQNAEPNTPVPVASFL